MRYVFDVEVYRNFFCVVFKNYDSKEITIFEISERKNDYKAIKEFILTIQYTISFNGNHYDNLILMCLMRNNFDDQDYFVITNELKNLSDEIIEHSEDFERFGKIKRKYAYNLPYNSIDLFLYWSKMLRISKKLSLKSIAVNMNWPKIQELPIEPHAIIQLDQMDLLIEYCINDVSVTEELARRKSADINLRLEARKKYGFDCLSWDGVKIGLNILLKRYCDRVGKTYKEIEDLRSKRYSVNIGDIILPLVKFKKGDISYRTIVEDKKIVYLFTSPQGVYQYLKNLTVTETNQINCRLFYNNTVYDILSGGIHSKHKGEVVECGPNEYYEDIDVYKLAS